MDEVKTVTLCTKGSCCPRIEFCKDGTVLVVAHEDAGFVPLTRDEALMMADAIRENCGGESK